MKYLSWLKDNINLVSFIAGTICLIAGKADIGHVLLQKGGSI